MNESRGLPPSTTEARVVSVGVIGTGFIGQQHLRSWSRIGVQLHVYGRTNLGQYVTEFAATPHRDIDSLIDAVDVVDVCVPTHLHSKFVLAAALRRRHVICEKPIALTVDDAMRMLGACQAVDRRLFIAHVVRYFPEYVAFRQGVLDGRVGEVAVVRLSREAFTPNRPPDNWLFDPQRSGGIIGDLMIHDIDYSMWLAGPVSRVYAKAIQVASSNFEDHAYAVLTHRSGALTHLTASWAQVPPTFRTRIEVAGSTGLMTYDTNDAAPLSAHLRINRTADLAREVGLPCSATVNQSDGPFTTELRDFLGCIISGAKPQITALESIEALRIAVAARESSRTGHPVEVVGAVM